MMFSTMVRGQSEKSLRKPIKFFWNMEKTVTMVKTINDFLHL